MMKRKVCKSSSSVALFLAAAMMLALAISPSISSATVFNNDTKPAFSVTYPNDWVANPDNVKLYHVLFSAKNAAGIPILNIQIREIPAGAKLEDTGKLYKKLILDPEQGVPTEIISDKVTTLKDGTKVNETLLKYKFKNWLPLQAVVIAVFKDNKWIRVDVHQSVNDAPSWDIVRSLTFKK
ncbi:MAG: hypothetical protein ABSE95_15945 [Thermodesulfobacteriota bacterium]|jgi:hypothetical protein